MPLQSCCIKDAFKKVGHCESQGGVQGCVWERRGVVGAWEQWWWVCMIGWRGGLCLFEGGRLMQISLNGLSKSLAREGIGGHRPVAVKDTASSSVHPQRSSKNTSRR